MSIAEGAETLGLASTVGAAREIPVKTVEKARKEQMKDEKRRIDLTSLNQCYASLCLKKFGYDAVNGLSPVPSKYLIGEGFMGRFTEGYQHNQQSFQHC